MMDYKKILKSVAKIEDDKYEYMVTPEAAIEAMELAVEESRKWISVDDDLPNFGLYIVAYFNPSDSTKKLYVIPIWRSRGAWYYDNAEKEKAEDSTLKIAYWTSFPAPPEILTQSEPIKKKLGI